MSQFRFEMIDANIDEVLMAVFLTHLSFCPPDELLSDVVRFAYFFLVIGPSNHPNSNDSNDPNPNCLYISKLEGFFVTFKSRYVNTVWILVDLISET